MAVVQVADADVKQFLVINSRPAYGGAREITLRVLARHGALAVVPEDGECWKVVVEDGCEEAVSTYLQEVRGKVGEARRLAQRWADLNGRLARLSRRELVRIRHPELLIELSKERNEVHEALARLLAELEGMETHDVARLRALSWVMAEMGGPAAAAVYRILPGDGLRVECDLPGVKAGLEWYESDWHDPGQWYRALIVSWELGEYTWEQVVRSIRVVDRNGQPVAVTWMTGGPLV